MKATGRIVMIMLFAFSLCALSMAGSVSAKTVTLGWNQNPESDVAGYRLYYRTGAGSINGTSALEGPSPIDVGYKTTTTLSGLDDTQPHSFTVTAYNFSGQESSFSNEVSLTPNIDFDRDGYSVTIDCNDNDPLIYPGAKEIIGNGIDENCNGMADDTSIAPATLQPIPQTTWKLLFVDSEELLGENGAAKNAFDGNPGTIWHTKWSTGNAPIPHEIRIDLGNTYGIGGLRYLPRQNGELNGTIGNYEIYLSSDGTTWGTPVAGGTFAKNSQEKEVLFTVKNARFIRFRALSEVNGNPWTSVAELNVLANVVSTTPICTDVDGDGFAAEGGACGPRDCDDRNPMANPNAPEIPFNGVDENCNGMADDDDLDGDGFGFALDCNDNNSKIFPGANEIPYNGIDENCNGMTDDDDLDKDGFLKSQDCNDNDPAINPSAIEILNNKIDENCNGMADDSPSIPTVPTLKPISQSSWSLKYVDSEELLGENGAAKNAFDGNPNTIWHTRWSTGNAPIPHEIQIDLGNTYSVGGFRYLPRQDGGVNGTVQKYQFFVSTDGKNWGLPVTSGTFTKDTKEKEILITPQKARYIKLKALTEINGNAWTSIAELQVMQ